MRVERIGGARQAGAGSIFYWELCVDWFWIIVIAFVVLGLIGKANEENKKKEEETSRKQRAEAARSAILASGDKESIRQLRLMEASYQTASVGRTGGNSASGNALGTAAAVAGGMVVGNAISGAIQSAQLQTALAEVQANLDATTASLGDVSGLDAGGDDQDFDT